MAISDADREAWNEMQRDAAPDVKVLDSKVSTARKGHELDCGCFILPGEKYRATSLIEDGKFARFKEHAYWQECRLHGDERAQARYDEEWKRRNDALAALPHPELSSEKE